MWADFIQSRPSGLTEKPDGIRQCESLGTWVFPEVSVARGPGEVYGWSWPVMVTLFGP